MDADSLKASVMVAKIHTAYVAYSDQRSEVDKCLEGRAELSDLLKKKIQGEVFTEADSERIAKCVNERQEAYGVLAVCMIGLVVVGIGLCVWAWRR